MLTSIFATKIGMTQAWDTTGKRLSVTRCKVAPQVVIAQNNSQANPHQFILGFGTKKQKNMKKPLRSLVAQSGFSSGVKQFVGVLAKDESAVEQIKLGAQVMAEQVLAVGDVVKVRGVSKGRGFAGAIKRHGFHGGPATHGQSDRARAVGSIGSGTTPGRVVKGKRMPGHYGQDTVTVRGLTVLHIDPQTQEIWLSGPVPGSLRSDIEISPMGKTKTVNLDLKASQLTVPAEPQSLDNTDEVTQPTSSTNPVATEPEQEVK